MQEKDILKIAVIVTIVGLLFLFFYSETVTPKQVTKLDAVEEIVQMKGVITRVQQHDSVVFIELEGERTETTAVIVFTDSMFLKKGDEVSITGTVEEYEGKKEIIASKIELK